MAMTMPPPAAPPHDPLRLLLGNRLGFKGIDGIVDRSPLRLSPVEPAHASVAWVSPDVGWIDIEFPRLTTRRYLPAVFSEDPQAAAFTDRFLSVFDTTYRGIEDIVDNQARFYSAASTPATSVVRGRPDF